MFVIRERIYAHPVFSLYILWPTYIRSLSSTLGSHWYTASVRCDSGMFHKHRTSCLLVYVTRHTLNVHIYVHHLRSSLLSNCMISLVSKSICCILHFNLAIHSSLTCVCGIKIWCHYTKVSVKVKWSRYRPSVAQRVGRGIALLFHDHSTRRGWAVSSMPRPHFTPGKDPVPIVQEAGWAPGPVWTVEKSRPHRDSIPDRPACSQSLYRLSYWAHIMA
jgi:hypothetical protein